MNLIKTESRKELDKVLKDAKNPTVLLASEVIHSNEIVKKVPVFRFGPILIPSVKLLNEYLDNGITGIYETGYYDQLKKPNILFLINEMLYRMVMTQGDLIVAISADEVEYEYLKMFNRFLSITYHCKMISAKKYKKGVSFQGDEKKLKKKLESMRASLGNKLADSGYELYALLGIICTKSSIKEYPKETQRKIKRLMENGGDW